tara:strand:- start:467 stop:721 length:255 start_codon:yes stop_codon:yes gene_type:complete
MDPIYSSITSHHTISQIDKGIEVCDYSLIIVPLAFIFCWTACILYNAISSQINKNPLDLFIYSIPIGLVVAILGLFYLSKAYDC